MFDSIVAPADTGVLTGAMPLDEARRAGLSSLRLSIRTQVGKGLMRRLHDRVLRSLVAVAVLLVAGCGTAEWVHPNKPKDEFSHDYSTCESEAYENPKAQGGMKMIIQQSIDRCLAKKGWVLRQKR